MRARPETDDWVRFEGYQHVTSLINFLSTIGTLVQIVQFPRWPMGHVWMTRPRRALRTWLTTRPNVIVRGVRAREACFPRTVTAEIGDDNLSTYPFYFPENFDAFLYYHLEAHYATVRQG